MKPSGPFSSLHLPALSSVRPPLCQSSPVPEAIGKSIQPLKCHSSVTPVSSCGRSWTFFLVRNHCEKPCQDRKGEEYHLGLFTSHRDASSNSANKASHLPPERCGKHLGVAARTTGCFWGFWIHLSHFPGNVPVSSVDLRVCCRKTTTSDPHRLILWQLQLCSAAIRPIELVSITARVLRVLPWVLCTARLDQRKWLMLSLLFQCVI